MSADIECIMYCERMISFDTATKNIVAFVPNDGYLNYIDKNVCYSSCVFLMLALSHALIPLFYVIIKDEVLVA